MATWPADMTGNLDLGSGGDVWGQHADGQRAVAHDSSMGLPGPWGSSVRLSHLAGRPMCRAAVEELYREGRLRPLHWHIPGGWVDRREALNGT